MRPRSRYLLSILLVNVVYAEWGRGVNFVESRRREVTVLLKYKSTTRSD